jgi:alpha,alpha-trehalose phosphorylase
MPRRQLRELPDHLFPADEWRIVETRFSNRWLDRTETVFALSNGYVGLRGGFDEGRPGISPGTFVAGFHEGWPIVYPEEAYGLARVGQTIVNVPDATIITLDVDDEPLFIPVARLRRYSRVLDMRLGTVVRELLWSTPAGKHVSVRSCRLVSLEHRHLAAVSYEVTLLDHTAPVVITSRLLNRQDAAGGPGVAPDPRTARPAARRVLVADVATARDGRLLAGYRTGYSGMTLGVGVEHVIETAAPHTLSSSAADDLSEVVLAVEGQPGVPIRVTKYVTYHSSGSAAPRDLVGRCARTLERSAREGFDSLVTAQRDHLDRFWDRTDVRVTASTGSAKLRQAVRWNLFQVAQATWRAEGSGVPAKGLTGAGYDGHYFWDTEIYVLPMLAYTWPRIARNLLRFRHSMLPRARERARDLSHSGAMFPWRTIDGDEASANFQAGTAQYHINADIAYAVRRYVHVRGDTGFLVEVGAEILAETARMWEDLGFYDTHGVFHIHGVTGPDEYTTVVNDNTYTNLMARLNLSYAATAIRRLREERPADHAALAAEIGLAPDEVDRWERAAAAMCVPYDSDQGIHPQDAAFLDREVWDLKGTPPERFPLLLHYHPLVIYRFQVVKQADVVLAMFLLGNEFSDEDKERNFEYYDALTTGDSSLSACVQSIVAAELGREEQALEYFRHALLMDLADIAGNTSDGVHIASAAGVWLGLVQGFGGVRDFDGRLSFDPRLPRAWECLSFSLRFCDRQLRIELRHDEERYVVEEGDALDVTVRGTAHTIAPGAALTLSPTAA